MKTGIFSRFGYFIPIEERLELIKQAGFDSTSLWWGNGGKDEQIKLARKIGLEIDNIHTPFNNPNDLWVDTLNGDDYFNVLISCIKDAAHYNIPICVIHITDYINPPELTSIGLNRIQQLVVLSENKDVYLALENLNYIQHLDYIFDNIQSKHLGFCYDSGHENLFHNENKCLSKYMNRLLAVHINDNNGKDNTHLLPFDGSIKWDKVMNKLNKSKNLKYLSLEVNMNPRHDENLIYKDLTAKEFLELSYKRIKKLGQM